MSWLKWQRLKTISKAARERQLSKGSSPKTISWFLNKNFADQRPNKIPAFLGGLFPPFGELEKALRENLWCVWDPLPPALFSQVLPEVGASGSLTRLFHTLAFTVVFIRKTSSSYPEPQMSTLFLGRQIWLTTVNRNWEGLLAGRPAMRWPPPLKQGMERARLRKSCLVWKKEAGF